MTLPLSPAPVTPQDMKVSPVDPFETLRAYANRDRSRLGDISGRKECNPLLDTGNILTSNPSPDQGRDAERLRFESPRANLTRYSSDKEHPRGHAREFHIQLAAMNLGRDRRMVRVPADVDLDYIRFREGLKRKLIGQGDECIWRGLEAAR
jgi:hypothetical protein